MKKTEHEGVLPSTGKVAAASNGVICQAPSVQRKPGSSRPSTKAADGVALPPTTLSTNSSQASAPSASAQ